jgi:hypothetical protein
MAALLSESQFVAGHHCPNRLWWLVHEPDAPELQFNPVTLDRLEQGRQVHQLARRHAPGGVHIDTGHRAVEHRLATTQEAVDAQIPIIYGACFVADEVFVATDILERDEDGGFRLVAVESTTEVKERQITSLGIQTHVLRRNGADVRRVEVMHLNSECRHPDLGSLFVRTDVTRPVTALQAGMPDEIGAQLKVLEGPRPDIPTGEQCFKGSNCPFRERCWPGKTPDHVQTLYRMRLRDKWELMQQGVHSIRDLPREMDTTVIQERQRRAIERGGIVAELGLRTALEEFEPPRGYLDFETIGLAVPIWPGCNPWQQVPVQFSCHLEHGNGGSAHHEYLATPGGDPRRDLAEALVHACRGARSIAVYNAGFERRCIRELAEAVPQLGSELLAINDRIVDLLPVLQDYVYHPDFLGSFGLKSVLPALVPELSYADLEVSQGDLASIMLARLLLRWEQMDPVEVPAQRQALLEYCKMDTWALVKLRERLAQLAG